MKTTSLPLVLLVGLAGGCKSAPPEKPSVPLLPSVASFPEPAGVRIPEVVRAYAIGAYIDPDDPAIRHDAHWIQRVEMPARWDLRSALPAPVVAPEPASLPAVATLPAERAVEEPATAPTLPLEPALMPNADGVLDLVAAREQPAEAGNPFAVISPANGAAREVSLHVSGVIGGARPCAVINDRLIQTGEVMETLAVERIEDRSVLLRFGETKLRIPVGDSAVRVRLPL